MADQRVHGREQIDDGFRAARRAGMGLAAPRAWISIVLLAEAGIAVAVPASMANANAQWDGAAGLAGLIVVSALFGLVAALLLLPVVVALCGRLILRWTRIAPTWRRAAAGRPTRVLHGEVLPGARQEGKHVVRVVRVHDADVLPWLHLAFVRGAGEELRGPAVLELFAGDDVGGPVRLRAGEGAAWAFDVTTGPTGRPPEVEAEVELGGPPSEPSVTSWSVRLGRDDGVHGVPLSPVGDGFASARRAGTRGTSLWRLGLSTILPVVMTGTFLLFTIGGALGEPWAESEGALDPRNPWQLALLVMIALLPLLVLWGVRGRIRRRRLIGPAWRRAARGQPTLELTGAMVDGTRVMGRHGMRTVRLDRPVGRDEPGNTELQLLFVTAEGRGERLSGEVGVQLFAEGALRGPARVQDARRAEWAFAVRDAAPGDVPVRDDGWDDDGWTDLSADSGDGGDGDGGE
ncbi:hypothetical protein [Myceligenerans pegani]|uniref:DUF2207 domain-containing protein n=1 Tax=Myceligenerans pegani TaxID=2776917 RepID=A0ABR9N1D1_9MICO|nr:hypothetical protein [Myceligenerans sp. TRM 65318]MBE1876954.1 hypothetical protein [Myceligenerans sp. TRM 65318]MBE3019225.1 hypothetical protein [Myceligenerans sp. TRM 65318]